MTKDNSSAPTEMRRVLGLIPLTLVGIGITVGAGIYVLVGVATQQAGNGVWLAFLIAGLLSVLTGLGYAELASMYPKANAEHEFARHVFPDWIAFLTGWLMVAALMIAAAAVARGFAGYLQIFWTMSQTSAAIALILVTTAISSIGVRKSTMFNAVLSCIQIGGLLMVIVLGVSHIGEQPLTHIHSYGGVLSAAALVFFAFIGFDEVTSLSDETRDPHRTVPRALLLTLAISTLLYVLVSIVAISVLGTSRLGSSQQPLADVVSHVLNNQAGVNIIAIAALVATVNTTLLCVTASSRLLYGMSRAGALPLWFGVVEPKRLIPRRALGIAMVVAIGFTFLESIAGIASVTDLAVFLIFIVVNLCVIILRKTKPDEKRPFRVPGAIRGVPVISVLGLLSALILLPRIELRAWFITLLISLSGMAMYLWQRRSIIRSQSSDYVSG